MIILKTINYHEKLKTDIPYLKEKMYEYLNKYSKENNIEERMLYIKYYFIYKEIYTATINTLNITENIDE